MKKTAVISLFIVSVGAIIVFSLNNSQRKQTIPTTKPFVFEHQERLNLLIDKGEITPEESMELKNLIYEREHKKIDWRLSDLREREEGYGLTDFEKEERRQLIELDARRKIENEQGR